jgi:hypothetical protein
MTTLRRWGATAAILLALTLAPLAVGCAPQSTSGDAPVATQRGNSDAGAADDAGTDQGQTEGAPDPSQPTKDAGIATTFGGPSQGDQGTKILADDRVCKTVALFWGADIPEGVTYRIDAGVGADVSGSSPVQVGGLHVEPGPCDDQGSIDCLSTTLDAKGQPGTCSVVVRLDSSLHEGTALLFVGTLSCPDAGTCHAVETRDAQQGPAVFVCSPTWLQADDTRQCDAGTWKASE